MSQTDTNTFIKLALDNWHKPIGLVGAAAVLISIVSIVIIAIKPSTVIIMTTYVGALLLLTVIWFQTNRIPKTKAGKVGFIISMYCTDEKEKRRIKEDFIVTLQQLLRQGKTGGSFQFIEVPNHFAEKITDPYEADKLRINTGAHFLLYGRVRERILNGKLHHVLNFDGLVSHNPIPDNVSRRLSKEFSELLPRKIKIAEENDLLSFEFTSQWTGYVARYIIGIASSLSGDLKYAEDLYTDVSQILVDSNDNFPIYDKLRHRLPSRFAEIYEARAAALYEKWSIERDPALITKMGEQLEKIEPPHDERYKVILLFSLYYFLSKRDTEKAIAVLNKCRTKIINDQIWRFNLAYFHAYKRELQNALMQYSTIANYSLEPPLLAQVEESICWIIEEEPNQYQFYFCLGYINWQMKGDNIRAIEDFENFLQYCQHDEYLREKEMVKSWLKQLHGFETKRKEKTEPETIA